MIPTRSYVTAPTYIESIIPQEYLQETLIEEKRTCQQIKQREQELFIQELEQAPEQRQLSVFLNTEIAQKFIKKDQAKVYAVIQLKEEFEI